MGILVTINSDVCKGCELCTSVCPKKILSLDTETVNKKGYHPAAVTDMESCVGCLSCARICPDSAITIERM